MNFGAFVLLENVNKIAKQNIVASPRLQVSMSEMIKALYFVSYSKLNEKMRLDYICTYFLSMQLNKAEVLHNILNKAVKWRHF